MKKDIDDGPTFLKLDDHGGNGDEIFEYAKLHKTLLKTRLTERFCILKHLFWSIEHTWIITSTAILCGEISKFLGAFPTMSITLGTLGEFCIKPSYFLGEFQLMQFLLRS